MPPLVFVDNLEDLTLENKYYRNVLFTTKTKNMQLVLMNLLPGEEIRCRVDGRTCGSAARPFLFECFHADALALCGHPAGRALLRQGARGRGCPAAAR